MIRFINKFLVNLFLFVQIEIPAQSWDFIGGPTGIYPNDVIITKDGRVLCSTWEGVFISDDYGDNWKISTSSQNFRGVFSLTERANGDIIAAAYFAIILSTDRGESWIKISDQNMYGYASGVKESLIDSSLYFTTDKLYKSTNGGFNWKVIWQGGIIDGFTIDESGWIYFSVRGENILVSSDNGKSFSPLLIGYDLTNAVVDYMYPDHNGGLYFRIFQYPDWIVHFGNNKLTYIEDWWTNVPLGVTSNGDLIYKSNTCLSIFELSTKQSRNISCPDFVKDQYAKNVVTKGNTWIANFQYLGIHRSDDAGKTWKSINTGLGYKESTAIEITKSGKLIVSAFNGAFWGSLYHSTDEGKTWIQKNPSLDPYFADIDKLNNGKLIASGSYGVFTADEEGLNWSQTMNSDNATYIFVSKDGTAYTGTHSRGMMISRNNGQSWSSPNELEKKYFTAFGESSSGRIFAASSAYTEGIYYSDDNGYNWSYVNPFSFYGINDFITVNDTIYAATSGGIYISDDNGMNWERMNYKNIKKFELAPNGDLIGINPGEGIIRSSDKGINWETLGEELRDRKIWDMCFDQDNLFYTVTDSGIFRNNEYIYPYIIKPDYGADKLWLEVKLEWSEVPSADNYELQVSEDSLLSSIIINVSTKQNSVTINSLLPDKTYYWQVKAHSIRFNDLYTSIGKFSTAPPFSISQNYPNPFNSSTIIEFYVPYNSRIKLKVYNILGELVKNLIDEEFQEGKYSYNWEVSSLPSGIYFLHIEGIEFKEIKKAILLK
jgi:photosystem II stability/assembly factor-like uncharacterized protein